MNLVKRDIRYKVKFSGIELEELKKHTFLMAGVFGLGITIRESKGRPIKFYSWELDCLNDVFEIVLNDPKVYPDKNSKEYKAMYNLSKRIYKLQ